MQFTVTDSPSLMPKMANKDWWLKVLCLRTRASTNASFVVKTAPPWRLRLDCWSEVSITQSFSIGIRHSAFGIQYISPCYLIDVPDMPGRPVASKIWDCQVYLVWSEPVHNGNSPIRHYRVDCRPQGKGRTTPIAALFGLGLIWLYDIVHYGYWPDLDLWCWRAGRWRAVDCVSLHAVLLRCDWWTFSSDHLQIPRLRHQWLRLQLLQLGVARNQNSQGGWVVDSCLCPRSYLVALTTQWNTLTTRYNPQPTTTTLPNNLQLCRTRSETLNAWKNAGKR